DLNGDGKLEIIFGGYDNNVYVTTWQGDAFPGWPVNLGTDVFSSPAVADLNGDGTAEIVIALKDDSADPQYGRILVFDSSGNVKPGWPRETPGQVYPSPALADLDGDGDLEIILGCGNYNGGDPARSRLFALNADGTDVAGWPVNMPDTLYASPAVGDLDGDGLPEIVIGCYDGNIYAYRGTGVSVPGWPVATGDSVYSSAAITDIEGDGMAEVCVASDDGFVYLLRHDGQAVAGYPIETGARVFASVCVDDMDADGDLEIAAASSVGDVFLWNDAGKAARTTHWSKFRSTLHNTGVYMPASTNPPVVILFGYWNTYITAPDGGTMTLLTAVIDNDGPADIATVELYYDGVPTGIYLADDGANGDFAAGDGVFGLVLPFPGGAVPPTSLMLQVMATDGSGATSALAPYLEVN
ncbi:VCBS repeat-containing protein, partial [bacterium]|nr:VCBS repeat-containing protein [candidate division CSSED10-310 bacterium]